MAIMQAPNVSRTVVPRRFVLESDRGIGRGLYGSCTNLDVERPQDRRLKSAWRTAYSAAGRSVRPRLSKGPAMTREEITAMFKRREIAWDEHDAATLAADHSVD